jgi:hypothetical protein
MCWNGDGKIVEAVGRRGQEVNRSIALPLCLTSSIVLHRKISFSGMNLTSREGIDRVSVA